jgi:hypothetical protein
MTRTFVDCPYCGADGLDRAGLREVPHAEECLGPALAWGLRQLQDWLTKVPDERLPPTLVRTYPGDSQEEAARILAAEAPLLASRG